MAIAPLCTSEVTVKAESAAYEAHPVRCKRWSCEVCHQLNRAKVIRIAIDAKPNAMLTLTVNSKTEPDPAAAALRLKEGLRLLRLRLKRHPKMQNFEFLAVFEKHKSGHPHLHLLIKSQYIPWRWLRKVWEEITGSFMVDIRKVDQSQRRLRYVAKYLGKDLSPFPGCKRWWRSHGFSEKDDPTDEEALAPVPWQRWHSHYPALRTAIISIGGTVEDCGREGIRWQPPPGKEVPLHHLMMLAGSIGVRWRGAGR